jgi:hypothetical protein
MILDDVLRNPVLKKALEAGEQQVGKVVGRLLANDRVTSGLSSLVTSAVQAKQTFDRGVREALHAANLPSKDDVAALRKKLDELESMLDGLAAKVGDGAARGGAGDRGRGPDGEGDGGAP